MADPWHHAVSASRAWGGKPEAYLEVEKWFDESKALMSDFRHRALRHHSEGIELACRIFGQTIGVWVKCPDCKGEAGEKGEPRYSCERCTGQGEVKKQVPVRWIGERHVREDMGRIPSAVDWLKAIKAAPWMNRPQRLSQLLETPGDPWTHGDRPRPSEGLTERQRAILRAKTQRELDLYD